MIYGDTKIQKLNKNIKLWIKNLGTKLEAPLMMALSLEKFEVMTENALKKEYDVHKSTIKKIKRYWNRKSFDIERIRYVGRNSSKDAFIRAIKCRWTNRFYFVRVDKTTEPMLVNIYNSIYKIHQWW